MDRKSSSPPSRFSSTWGTVASSGGSDYNKHDNRGKGPALSDWGHSHAKIALREVGIRNSDTRFPIQELPFNNTDCASNTQAMLSILLSVVTPPSESVKEAPRSDYVSAILFAIAKEVRFRIDRKRRFFFMCGRMPASGAEEFVFVFPTSRGDVVVGGCECHGATAISKHGQSLMEIAGMTMSNSRFFTRLPVFNIETDGIEWVGRISLPTLPSEADGMQMKVCKFYLESALDYKNLAQVSALQRKVHYLFRYCVDYAVHELVRDVLFVCFV